MNLVLSYSLAENSTINFLDALNDHVDFIKDKF